jgi:hypothetical protein
MGIATRTDTPTRPPPAGFARRDRERTGPGSEPIAPGGGVPANGKTPPLPGSVDTAAGTTSVSERDIALGDLGGAKLLVADVRVALLLLDEARHQAVKRLFGVSRDQSSTVTLIALAMLAQAAHEKMDQMLRGPGGPTRADVALGAVAARELLTWIPGRSSRDTRTLLAIAVAGALVRPVLSRTAHGIRTSSHRARLSVNHRYGHLLPARGQRLRGER